MPDPVHTPLPPLCRILPNRVWRTYPGGRRLDELAGIVPAEDSHFPEDWLLSDTAAVNPGRAPEGVSLLEFDGKPIAFTELVRRNPEFLLGREHLERFGEKAAFLLKFLDSAVRLQLQCHPTIEFSRKHLNANAGKTEGYVILGHREGIEPRLYLGFQHPVSRERFKRIVETQDFEEMLRLFEPVPVKTGDVFLVPGGVPHAIGAGIFMIEIMEPTDFVSRFEFRRDGCTLPEAARFMGRDIDFGLSMLDFTVYSPQEVKERFFRQPRLAEERDGSRRWTLFGPEDTPCFRADRLHVAGRMEIAERSFSVLIVTGGAGTIRAGGMELDLKYADRILIPSGTRRAELSGNGLDAVLVRPPAAR